MSEGPDYDGHGGVAKVRLSGVAYAYDGIPALDGVNLLVPEGAMTAVVGPNGSGKTTLLQTVSGVIKPSKGVVYLDVKDLSTLEPREIARRMAALEQERSIGFEFTVREIVEWGRIPRRARLERWRPEDEAAVRRAMEATRIEDLADRAIQELSGGERQRAFVALALAQEPQVMLLDEPTAHLDLRYQVEILDLIRSLIQGGLTVITALHDLNLAARYADRLAVLSCGRIVAQGCPGDVLSEELIEAVWNVEVRVQEGPDGLTVLPRTPVERRQAARSL